MMIFYKMGKKMISALITGQLLYNRKSLLDSKQKYGFQEPQSIFPEKPFIPFFGVQVLLDYLLPGNNGQAIGSNFLDMNPE